MKFKSLLFAMLLALGALGVIPALAQNSTSTSVAFNGFSFSYPSALATNVSIMQTPGDAATVEQPGGPDVKHTEFILYSGTDVPQDYFGGVASIHVYNTADFAGYQQAGQEYTNLQTLLSQRPDLSRYMVADTGTNANNLPYLPGVGASQAIRARASYIDTPSISGVSYITVFRQDVSPFTGDQFLYTFQGLSKDGAHYVAAIFTLNTTLFPATIPSDFDENAFGQKLNEYMTQSIATLNGGQPTDFTPSLAALDALVQSFSFTGAPVTTNPPPATTLEPTFVPTTANTDPTLGGLANKTWTLVSYGDPANPTTVLNTGKPITLVFSGTGVSGSGSCNGYGGSFQYDANTLSFSQLIHTMIACDQPINDQENAYFDALSKTSTYQISGTQLIINYDGGVLTFTSASVTTPPVAITEQPPIVSSDPTLGGLANKTWTLVSYGDPANPTPVLQAGQPITLVFSGTGVSGNGSCNSFNGIFQYDTNTLTFGQLVRTLMACDQPINDQENAYFDALSKTTTYQINGTQLLITYDGGVLTFNGA